MDFATAQLTQLILADIPVEKSGQASSTQSTAWQVGSALGIAILGTALFTTLRASTESRLSDQIAADPSIGGLVDAVSHSAGALIAPLSQDPATEFVADAGRRALTQGVSVAAWVGVVALVVGLLTTLRLGGTPASAVPGTDIDTSTEMGGCRLRRTTGVERCLKGALEAYFSAELGSPAWSELKCVLSSRTSASLGVP